MEKKNNPNFLTCIFAIISVINLAAVICLSVYIFYTPKNNDSDKFLGEDIEKTSKYTLYIGTNDKDTYTQVIPLDKAKDIVDKICVKYTGGFTGFDAVGGWTDEKNNFTHENTLVYVLYDVTEEQLKNIMDDTLKELNQNSILVETNDTEHIYYDGK